MRFIYILILLLLNAQGSCESQPSQSVLDVVYHAHSRGFNYEIAVKNDTIRYANSAENVTSVLKVLSENQKKELQSLIQSIDISSLENLKRPSSKSFTDRSAQAKLAITSSDGDAHSTPEFDHGNPPAAIENLIEYLQEIIN